MEGNQLVGLALLIVAFFGSLINWMIVKIIVKAKSFNTSFMFLTFTKSLCDAVISTLYLVYVTPTVILADKFLSTNSWYSGFVILVSNDISMNTHFITSLNRFSAVFFPIPFRSLFSIESTRIYLVIAASISLVILTTVHFFLGCHIQYDPYSWMFFYNTTIPVCNWFMTYGDFVKNLCMTSIDFGIDIVTLFKIQRIRRQFKRGQRSESFSQKQTNFLKQTFGQSFCYVIAYANYLIVPEMYANKYMAFFMSVMSWCVISLVAGLFTTVYNCEIRKKLAEKPFKIGTTPTSGKL